MSHHPSKSQQDFFVDTDKIILKFICKDKGTGLATVCGGPMIGGIVGAVGIAATVGIAAYQVSKKVRGC